jgi:hypothetical protein
VGNIVSKTGVLSAEATLTVVKPVSIVEEPKDVRVAAGGTASFSVKAAGAEDGAYRYEWRRNGLPITGGTAATLSLPIAAGTVGFLPLGPKDTGVYDVDVYNVDASGAALSHAYSRKALLQVYEAPMILVVPADQTVETSGESNRSAGFRVVASGTPPLQYSWTRVSGGTVTNGTLTGALTTVLPYTTDSFVITNAGTADIGEYTVRVSGPMGTSASAKAKLQDAAGTSMAVFASQPSSLIGVEQTPIALKATAKEGYRIVGWQRTVERLNSSGNKIELVREELLNAGSLDLGGG